MKPSDTPVHIDTPLEVVAVILFLGAAFGAAAVLLSVI